MSSDESIWRMRVLSTSMPEYVGELIRCKDCKYFEPRDDMRPSWCWRDPDHAGHGWPTSENGFCAWAEKRKD